MTYEEMCRYIVAKEGYDWESFLKLNSNRKREIVRVRQVCFYLGPMLFRGIKQIEMGRIFDMERSSVSTAISAVANDIDTNADIRIRVHGYYSMLTAHMYSNAPLDAIIPDNIIEDMNIVLEKMKSIASAYCRITGKKII